MAGGNLAWFAGLFPDGGDDFYRAADVEAASVPPGSEGLLYLPYLMGERTPIWDPDARGAFIGLTSRHTRAHLYRAVLEGVAFAFRQIVDIAADESLASVVAIDGGAKSDLWRGILSSVLRLPVRTGAEGAGTGLGGAFLAAIGVGQFTGPDAIEQWARPGGETSPESDAAARYDGLLPVYEGLYEKLRDDFHALGA